MKRELLLISIVAALFSGCAGTAPRSDRQSGGVGGVEVVSQSQTVSTSPLSGTPGALEVLGGDEADLRKFIGRVLNYGGMQGGSTLIQVGKMPASLPFSLPLSEGVVVLGSIVREDPQSGSTEIYLDTDLDPEAALDFYREHLTGDEWIKPERGGLSGGFVSEPFLGQCFCNVPTQAVLWVSAFTTLEETTDLRLSVQQPSEYSVCNQDTNQGYVDRVQQIMPVIQTPPGSLVRSNGMSSSGTDGTMSAIITTDQSPTELVAFYGRQLKDAGWQPSGSGSGDEAAWSYWTNQSSQADSWAGTLLVFQSHIHSDELLSWFYVELK